MSERAAQGAAGHAEVVVGSGEAVVRLDGDWCLASALPDPDDVVRRLTAVEGVERVGFDLARVEAWDSALVTYLLAVRRAVVEMGAKSGDDTLPIGVRKLLWLALTVPHHRGAAPSARASWLWLVGARAARVAADAAANFAFVGRIAVGYARLLRGKAQMRAGDLFLLVQACGADAFGIISMVNLLVGLSIAFVGASQLSRFGAEGFIAELVGFGMVREMAPSITAFVMAGRTGAAFAAQLGTMQVNEEIDALETAGVDPVEFLVLPRLTAMVLMMPVLYFYACALGITGGALVALAQFNIALGSYYEQTMAALHVKDFVVGMLKSAVFGGIVAFYGCYCGMRCGRSAAAVGVATTSAVVKAMVGVIVANMIFAIATNVLGV